jgi:hypothetical protein
MNIVTNYKMKRINRSRFKHQILLWATILVLLLSSYPAYNLIIGKSLFSSEDLSALDIIQTTVIVVLFYIMNSQRQKIDATEKTLRLLHSTLSIRLSEKDYL